MGEDLMCGGPSVPPESESCIEFHTVSHTFSHSTLPDDINTAPTSSGIAIEEEYVPQVVEEGKPDDRKEESATVGLPELFRYANRKERMLIAVGVFGAVVCGALIPCFSLIFGELLDSFNTTTDFMGEVSRLSLVFIYFGIGMCIGAFLEIYLFMYTAELQAKRVRELYLASLLSQEIGWHDLQTTGDLAVKLTADTTRFQNGINDKFGQVVQNIAGFFGGLVIALVKGWELTLVILATAPILGFVAGIMGSSVADSSSNEQKEYGQAGAVAQETLASVRTIASNQLERVSMARYDKYLWDAYHQGIRRAWMLGGGMGTFWVVIFSVYGFGLWYGSTLIRDGKEMWPGAGKYTGGSVITVFYALITAVMMLGQAAPHFAAIAGAQAAAYPLFDLIERKSAIDSRSTHGLRVTPASLTGRLRFRDVHFTYPSRTEAPVLRGLTLDVEPGFIALVGPSGCGKSSTISLIERFYDPAQGSVQIEVCVRAATATTNTTATAAEGADADAMALDVTTTSALPALPDLSHWDVVPLLPNGDVPAGCRLEFVDLRQLHVASLRAALGLVSQEPVLFAGTVKENILYGNPTLSDEDVQRCAKLANAHDFILKLQHGYDTQVGEGGRLLSGGQKQRVAIARMLAGERGIMMLDEATAALDNKSERLVQAALDNLIHSEGGRKKTSLVIAHRLSTIRNADRIVVLDKGVVAESGTHAELMCIEDGIYRGLVHAAEGVPADATAANTATATTSSSETDGAEEAEAVALAEAGEVDPDEVVEGADGEATAYEFEASLAPEVSRIGHARTMTATEAANSHVSTSEESSFRRLMRLSKLQWAVLLFGSIIGLAEGCSLPIYAMLMSRMLDSFYDPDVSVMMDTTKQYAVWFFLTGLATGVLCLVRHLCLIRAGEALTFYIRSNTFASMLKQEIGWHDAHTAGILATRLASDALCVRTLIADRYGTILNVSANVLCSFIICFTADGAWAMSLVMLFVVFPVMGAAGVAQFKVISGFGSKSKDAIEKAGQVATEGVGNLRTVASFGGETALLTRFQETLHDGLRAGHSSSLIAGVGFGGAQLAIFCCYALSFWFGGLMVEEEVMTFQVMLQVFLTVEMASMMMGTLFQQAPDFDKADAALKSIFDILDRPSLRDPLCDEGAKPELFTSAPTGEEDEDTGITFRDVHFHYPTRPNVPVLKGVNFHCVPNTVTAIVSESGGGKSTIFSLVQRHYDPIQFGGTDGYRDGIDLKTTAPYIMVDPNNPDKKPQLVPCDREAAGAVLINGHDIKGISIPHLRTRIGVVGQEPVLMTGTISDNIRCGDDTLAQEDVHNAARMANIHDLIIARFPKQYDTEVGAKGAQLSGGQKQRIALARAFARIGLGVDANGAVVRRGDANTLLLLDEATSALDNVSEKLVQAALNKAMQCTTTLVIAHRLTTVRNAHKIVVLSAGQVAEVGTHEELMQLKGHYYQFVGMHEGDESHGNGKGACDGDNKHGSALPSSTSASTVALSPSSAFASSAATATA